ncbi:MAG TPA: hypothetical protein VHX38_03850 [Pseudonocardiaceae bacterium]|nr:hypothetical protein [Pseudonocardiaceae bacterium]
MTVRRGVTVFAVLVVLAAIGVFAIMFVNGIHGPMSPYCTVAATGSGAADSTGSSDSSGSDSSGSGDFSFSPEQASNAATVAAVGLKLGLPPHAVTVALATAWQESKLINLTSGDRDSAGLFQQRPSEGWGTYAQVTDPVYASTSFYQHLAAHTDWASMSVTDAAQAVQHSATPDAYAQWEAEARAMASALTGETTGALTCHDLSVAPAKVSLVTAATEQWGTSTISGAHDAMQGWAMGSWLVANATQFGIDSVTVANRTWTAASGAWSTPSTGVSATATSADGTVSLHQVQVAPTS